MTKHTGTSLVYQRYRSLAGGTSPVCYWDTAMHMIGYASHRFLITTNGTSHTSIQSKDIVVLYKGYRLLYVDITINRSNLSKDRTILVTINGTSHKFIRIGRDIGVISTGYRLSHEDVAYVPVDSA